VGKAMAKGELAKLGEQIPQTCINWTRETTDLNHFEQ